MSKSIEHLFVPKGLSYSDVVNRMNVKYVIPVTDPLVDEKGTHYLVRVTKYTEEEYFENTIYGDPDLEQDCMDREMYG